MALSWDQLGQYSRLVNTAIVDPRAYQINIIKGLESGKNTLVILPTGLGKTIIAVFAIANALHKGKRAIILAPTKPLSEQHYKSLTKLLNIEEGGIGEQRKGDCGNTPDIRERPEEGKDLAR
jgi:ERCC4-related helicase